jgi:hypothetical protein
LATDAVKPPSETRVYQEGDHSRPKEVVPPGFLSALDPNPAVVTTPANPKTTGRRLALARWIASADHPLTARVAVNRFWQSLMGTGLVATPLDFGFAGEAPSDPALLDHLAREFVRDRWSPKRLVRRIVTSASYRRAGSNGASRRDITAAEGAVRRAPKRLSAEQLHDALLVTAGSLRPRSGGKPAWPDVPQSVLQAQPAVLDDNAERTKGWYPSPPDEQKVRALYLVQKRTVRVPFFEAFDLPENVTPCGCRTVSTVPTQAAALLNSPFAVTASRDFAARVESLAGTPETRIRLAFRLALQRPPDEREANVCRTLLDRHGLVAVCRALLNVNEFAYVD